MNVSVSALKAVRDAAWGVYSKDPTPHNLAVLQAAREAWELAISDSDNY